MIHTTPVAIGNIRMAAAEEDVPRIRLGRRNMPRFPRRQAGKPQAGQAGNRLSVKYRSDPRWSHIRSVRLISAHEVEAFAATVEHAK